MRDRKVQVFDNCPIPSHTTKQDRAENEVLKQEKGYSKAEKRRSQTEKGHPKTENDILKQ